MSCDVSVYLVVVRTTTRCGACATSLVRFNFRLVAPMGGTPPVPNRSLWDTPLRRNFWAPAEVKDGGSPPHIFGRGVPQFKTISSTISSKSPKSLSIQILPPKPLFSRHECKVLNIHLQWTDKVPTSYPHATIGLHRHMIVTTVA